MAVGGIGSFVASRDFGVARYLDTAHTTTVEAATGTWTFHLGPAPNGILTFDAKAVTIFGVPINLGASVGAMPYAGTITNYNGSAGTLTMTASGPLTFNFSGTFACAASGCGSVSARKRRSA